MIELYHYGFSSCSQKVRLVLEEKGLAYVSHEVDLLAGAQHEPGYVKLNPKHVVPTLVHDGRALPESSLIMKYLDDAFPEPPMRPTDARGRYVVDAWLKRVDEDLHPAAPALMFTITQRAGLLAQPSEAREAALNRIHDPRKRNERRSLLERGTKAPEFEKALRVIVETLDAMELALAEHSWLSGPDFGLADATVAPYVLRLEHLALDPLLSAEARPAVASWLGRAKARPAWQPAIEAWIPDGAVGAMRALGAKNWFDIKPLVSPPGAARTPDERQ